MDQVRSENGGIVKLDRIYRFIAAKAKDGTEKQAYRKDSELGEHDRDVVCGLVPVRGQEGEGFGHRLGYKHAIERIAMMARQLCRYDRVSERDRQLHETTAVHLVHQVGWSP